MADIEEMVRVAQRYGFGQVSVLQCFIPYTRQLLGSSSASPAGKRKFPLRIRFYLGIFADVFNTRILKTTIDQNAAALGAAAIAAVGCGLWPNFDMIDHIHKAVEVVEPDEANHGKYEKLLPVFARAAEFQARISDALREIEF